MKEEKSAEEGRKEKINHGGSRGRELGEVAEMADG